MIESDDEAEMKKQKKNTRRGMMRIALFLFAYIMIFVSVTPSAIAANDETSEEKSYATIKRGICYKGDYCAQASIMFENDTITEEKIERVLAGVFHNEVYTYDIVDMAIAPITDPVVPTQWIEAAQGEDMLINIFRSEYCMSMFGVDIVDPTIPIKIGASFGLPENDTIKKRLPGNNFVMEFAHRGDLPGRMTIEIYDNSKTFAIGEELYLYLMISEDKLERVELDKAIVVQKREGSPFNSLVFEIDHLSLDQKARYVLSDATLIEDKGEEKDPEIEDKNPSGSGENKGDKEEIEEPDNSGEIKAPTDNNEKNDSDIGDKSENQIKNDVIKNDDSIKNTGVIFIDKLPMILLGCIGVAGMIVLCRRKSLS